MSVIADIIIYSYVRITCKHYGQKIASSSDENDESIGCHYNINNSHLTTGDILCFDYTDISM